VLQIARHVPLPAPQTQGASNSSSVQVVTRVVVVVVLDVVVVVVTGQLGSPGCPVQVQSPALHWARRFLVHVLAAMPVKAPHAELTSSAQDFLLHACGGAPVAKEETKTPAPSATAANVTPALLVIVEPPLSRKPTPLLV
jgi:hypothetical protein